VKFQLPGVNSCREQLDELQRFACES